MAVCVKNLMLWLLFCCHKLILLLMPINCKVTKVATYCLDWITSTDSYGISGLALENCLACLKMTLLANIMKQSMQCTVLPLCSTTAIES